MAAQDLEARLRLTARDETAGAFRSAARNASSFARDAERQVAGFGRGMSASVAAIEASAGRLSGAWRTAGAALAGTFVAREAFTQMASFERQLTRIGITAEATPEQMKRASGGMKALANEMGLPLQEIVKGVESFASQGGRTIEEIMTLMGPVSAAAQASGADMKAMADSAGAVGRSLGVGADKMEEALDILASSGKSGMFELKDMAQYLPSLAPAFANLGYKGTEGLKLLASMLQTVRNQTGSSEEAATNLTNVLQKMASDETVSKFKDLGVYNLREQLDGVRKSGGDVLEFFIALTRSTLRGDLGKLNLLFGDQQMQKGMLALLSQPGDIDKRLRALGQTAGTVRRDLALLADDPQARIEKLTNAFGDLTRSVGSLLDTFGATEAIRNTIALMDQVGEKIRWLQSLKDKGPGEVAAAIAREAIDEASPEIKRGTRSMQDVWTQRGRDAIDPTWRAREAEGAARNAVDDARMGVTNTRERGAPERVIRDAEERLRRATEALARAREVRARIEREFAPTRDQWRREDEERDQRRYWEDRAAPAVDPDRFKRMSGDGRDATFQRMAYGREERETDEERDLWARVLREQERARIARTTVARNFLTPVGLPDDAAGGARIFGGPGGWPGGSSGGGAGGGGGPGGGSGSGGPGGGSSGPGGGSLGSGITGGRERPSGAQGKENVASWLAFAQRPVPEGGLGLSKEQAHGLVAGLQGESGSGLDPGAYNPNDRGKPSGGTAQWRDDRLRNLQEFARRQGRDWRDRDVQQQFLRHEMTGSGDLGGGSERGAHDAIRGQGTREGALGAMVKRFERPADPEGEARKRGRFLYGHDDAPATADGDKPEGDRTASDDAADDARESGLHVTSVNRDKNDPLTRANPFSAHTQGRAWDVRARTPDQADAAMAKQREIMTRRGMVEGRDYVIKDEVRNPAGHATGPHVHVQFQSPDAARRYRESRTAERGGAQGRRGSEVTAMPDERTVPGLAPSGGGENARDSSSAALEDARRAREELERPIRARLEAPPGFQPQFRRASMRGQFDREAREASNNSMLDLGAA